MPVRIGQRGSVQQSATNHAIENGGDAGNIAILVFDSRICPRIVSEDKALQKSYVLETICIFVWETRILIESEFGKKSDKSGNGKKGRDRFCLSISVDYIV